MRHRFWVTLSQSGNQYTRSTRPLKVETLARAEGKATALLRGYRLTMTDGKAWDRWSVSHASERSALPHVVAYGNADGTTWTQRNHGWQD